MGLSPSVFWNMSQREFFNAVEGAREVREFEMEQSWKRAQKIISLLAITYISQFPQKSHASARKNVETILSDHPTGTKKHSIGYTLEEIEEIEADALRTEQRMNKQLQKQRNGISGP